MSANDEVTNWVTTAQAAALLGKSDRTIRRWVADGRLPINRDTTPHLVDISAELADTGGQKPDTADTADTDRLMADIARLEAENAGLKADKDFLQNALAAALSNQQALIEAGTKRRWRWPWSKSTD